MAVESDKLGPGQLQIGQSGSVRAFGAAMKSGKVSTSVDNADIIKVLDGQSIADGGGETAKLEGEVFQAYDMDSLLAWSRAHAGQTMPFSYRARNDRALSVAGEVQVHSLDYGGDVDERATSSLEFTVVGDWHYYDATTEPTVTAATPADAETGATVTVTGTNLGATTGVTVSGTAATSFSIVSDTSLTLVMPTGSSGSAPIVVSGWAGASSSFAYTRG